jgi:hypothetical protein
MGKRLSVEGIAVVEGISRNKVMYEAKELHKFAPSLIGRPILKDHVNMTDNVIGKVTHAESVDNGKKIRYKGWITEDKNNTMEKVVDGRINNVSIGASAGKMIKEKEDSEYIIARDMTALELSLTPVPGVPDASITPSKTESFEEDDDEEVEIEDEDIEEMVKQGITELNESIQLNESKSQLNLKKEEIKMEGNEVKATENIVVQDSKVTELQVKLDEALKVIEAYKEADRKVAVEKYQSICASKKVKALDVANEKMETIQAFTSMVESIEVEAPKAEAPVEAPKEEPKAEPVKEHAMPKTKDLAEKKVEEGLSGYKVEFSDLGGFGFYKSY